jgi:preprotein translocase subunit SecE
MARVNPAQFVQQVRAEAAKLVWPNRKETLVTTAMVFVMAGLAATFFFLVDQLIGLGVDQILRLGG